MIEVSDTIVVIQVFEQTMGLDVVNTRVSLVDREVRFGVSEVLIGRVFSGSGCLMDGMAPIIADESLPILGKPINPVSRDRPSDFLQTGISAIDGFNTLVRGQKLPIFSASGLPANEIAAQILRQSKATAECIRIWKSRCRMWSYTSTADLAGTRCVGLCA